MHLNREFHDTHDSYEVYLKFFNALIAQFSLLEKQLEFIFEIFNASQKNVKKHATLYIKYYSIKRRLILFYAFHCRRFPLQQYIN